MFELLSRALARRYSLRLMLALFGCSAFFVWLFVFSSLPLSTTELKKLGNGADLLDVRLTYSAEGAYRTLDQFGPRGRARYFRFLGADFLYLISYGLAFSLLVTRIATALFGSTSAWVRLNLLPLGIAFADGIENLCICYMIFSYPDRSIPTATIAGAATFVKWSLTAVTLLFLVVAAILLLAKRLGFRFNASAGK